nr:MAG TPA: hypothetical protein [Caudoviricetes sp.]
MPPDLSDSPSDILIILYPAEKVKRFLNNISYN